MSTRRVKVSADLLDLLEECIQDICQMEDGVHKRDWLNECQTSKVSREKGGVIRLETDHDWKVAFMVWYHGNRDIASRLPRDRE